jgi:isoleucyl-tRNA synthetase
MASAALRDFADILTNWYVRRSRERFWAGDDRDAIDTLYTVLETLARVAAPLAPLVAEEIWRGLTGAESVHLTDWPDPEAFPADPELVAAMDRVRAIASSGLALRKAQSLRVRLPLAALTVVTPAAAALAPYRDIVRDELNVKSVEFVEFDDSLAESYGISRRLAVNARAAGPRIGKQVQQVIAAAKSGDWVVDESNEVDGVGGAGVTVGGVALHAGEFTLELELADPSAAVAFLPGSGFVILDTVVTPELAAEGLARDVVRAVQQARKDAGFDVSDRIALRLGSESADTRAAIETHRELIGGETLATSLEVGEAGEGAAAAVGEGASVTIVVERA